MSLLHVRFTEAASFPRSLPWQQCHDLDHPPLRILQEAGIPLNTPSGDGAPVSFSRSLRRDIAPPDARIRFGLIHQCGAVAVLFIAKIEKWYQAGHAHGHRCVARARPS